MSWVARLPPSPPPWDADFQKGFMSDSHFGMARPAFGNGCIFADRGTRRVHDAPVYFPAISVLVSHATAFGMQSAKFLTVFWHHNSAQIRCALTCQFGLAETGGMRGTRARRVASLGTVQVDEMGR